MARTPIDQELQAVLAAVNAPEPLSAFADVTDWPEFRRLLAHRLASLPGRMVTLTWASAHDRALHGPTGLELLVRIYRPAMDGIGGVPLPALLFVHGGGFAVGDLDLDDPRCRYLATRTPCVVISVGYRLAPEHPFPAGLDDVLSSWEWLISHHAELGIDPARVAVAGSSAGGALAAGACLALRTRQGPRPALLMLLHPALDDRLETQSGREYTDTPSWDSASNHFMWQQYLTKPAATAEAAERAAPARARSLSGLPPTFVVTTDNDPLEDEGKAFAARLADEGLLVDAHHQRGGFHAFDTFAPTTMLGLASLDRQAAVLRAGLAAHGSGYENG